MTKTQLKTYIEVLEATKKHWREDYSELKLFGGETEFRHVFCDTACPLCIYHKGNCSQCCLKHCMDRCDPWKRAYRAVQHQDKAAFMLARSAMLKRLNRALDLWVDIEDISKMRVMASGKPQK